MRVIVPGHTYELDNFEPTERGLNQRLQFIHKEPVDFVSSGAGTALRDAAGGPGRALAGAGRSSELVTVENGTTNEEVLKMLIDRMHYTHQRMASRETALAITKLEECLTWLGKTDGRPEGATGGRESGAMSSDISLKEDARNACEAALIWTLNRIKQDARVAELLGPGTETFAKLTLALAKLRGVKPSLIRERVCAGSSTLYEDEREQAQDADPNPKEVA